MIILRAVVTERDIKLELAREESAELASGDVDILHHSLSPAVCITVGMDLEIQQ